jgi:hypothetical protein
MSSYLRDITLDNHFQYIKRKLFKKVRGIYLKEEKISARPGQVGSLAEQFARKLSSVI